MWFSAFILLWVILWDLKKKKKKNIYDCLVKHLDILFNFFLKIDLIWWDIFSCNFKYIFIDEIGFIKKIVLVIGQINKRGGVGMGWESFPHHAGRGGDEARQNHAGWGRRPHPLALPCPAPLPSLQWYLP